MSALETQTTQESEQMTQDLYLDFETALGMCKELATGINQYCKETGTRFDRIITVPRGGLYVAMVLSQAFHFEAPEILNCGLTSYHKDTKKSDGNFREGQQPTEDEIRGQRILIPDDVFDSGRTQAKMIKRFNTQGASLVMSATLLDKPENHKVDIEPDFCIGRVPGNAWVHFPWEPLEHLIEEPSVYSGLGYSALRAS